jgi:hypothetical protein
MLGFIGIVVYRGFNRCVSRREGGFKRCVSQREGGVIGLVQRGFNRCGVGWENLRWLLEFVTVLGLGRGYIRVYVGK